MAYRSEEPTNRILMARRCRRQRIERGACAACKEPRVRGTTMCEKHLEAYRAAGRSEQARLKRHERAARKRALGICDHCSKMARPNRRSCESCAKREKEAYNRKVAARIEEMFNKSLKAPLGYGQKLIEEANALIAKHSKKE